MIQENITVGGHIKHYNMVIVIAEAESESESSTWSYFRPRRPLLRPYMVAVAEATWKNIKYTCTGCM